jgi:Na+/H+ antiporter NhaD/arsenite permease-like protein
MLTAIIIIFVIGYLAIALEHPLKVDKTASALLLGMLLWALYAFGAESIIPNVNPEGLAKYLEENPSLKGDSLAHQCLSFIINVDIVEHLGDIAQTILFLMGAMTIVELIDVHGGFTVITDHINTRNKRKLLWILGVLTFFLSAVLDNLTTTIVMLTLLRKFVADKEERWLYAGAIVIAANSGGAWSPIGDVTTILLWAKGNVTAAALIKYVFLPSVISFLIPILVISLKLKGTLQPVATEETATTYKTGPKARKAMFYLGVGGLIFVPIFKTITHLPPFIGILFVLGALWVFTECYYNGQMLERVNEHRIPRVISRIDMPSILFFLGILMAVAVLQATGILSWMAGVLDTSLHNIYAIDGLIGALSSIVDNVPMVAGVMGMYPVADPASVGYAAEFVVDGHFWGLLSYCAGVGGSMLIIGSAAGVIAMGIEKITFGWYLKRFSWLALLGYVAGIATYAIGHILW